MQIAVPAVVFALLLIGPGIGHATDRALESGFRFGDTWVLPSPDVAKLSTEDAKSIGAPYRYGVQIPVSGWRLGKKGLGQWRRQSDGSWRWRLEVVSPAARSLDFNFSRLVLPAGASLTLSGDGLANQRRVMPEDLSGPEYWSAYVAGERAVLELAVSNEQRTEVELELAAVTHGYRGLFSDGSGMEKSGSCNVDTVCTAGDDWREQIDSVGHYTFSKGGSSYVCSGTLMANTAGTTTPYFLTANHCLSTTTVANSVVVYWNYQSSMCRTAGSRDSGTPLPRSIATHAQSGATLRATHSASDFTLLELATAIPADLDAFWSGWDRTGSTPTSAVGIHHPAGHEKRIAVENQALEVSGYDGARGTSHWRVNDWDLGTTEGGSSGSGLWNQAGLLVGQLHGGYAACGNDREDYYGRLSVSWSGGGSNGSGLSGWLDPLGTGAERLSGYLAGNPPPIEELPPATFENTQDYPIRDRRTVESPIIVAGGAGNGPSQLTVNVDIRHSYIGDLIVDVLAPDGSVFRLHNRSGGGADDLRGNYAIDASQVIANGTWTLRVQDRARGDTGYINAWSLVFP